MAFSAGSVQQGHIARDAGVDFISDSAQTSID
jgi:hypothetical protein